MKKFFSVFILIFLMLVTWYSLESSSDIDFETHSSIQIKFAELIENALIKHRPNYQDLKIQKIWTEQMSENKVKAHYQYSFFDADVSSENSDQEPTKTSNTPQDQTISQPLLSEKSGAEQIIKGEAILVRQKQNSLEVSDASMDTWLVEKVQTHEGTLIFQNPELISE